MNEITKNLVESKTRRAKNSPFFILKKTMKTLDIKEMRKFVNLITQGGVYQYIGENLSEDFLREIKTSLAISDTFYDASLGYRY